MTVSTGISVPTTTPLFTNIYFIKAMRVVWWFVATLGLILFVVLIPANWNMFQTGVSSMNITPDEYSIYAPPLFEGLAQLGIPITLYAAFKILVSGCVLVIFYGMGFLIFRTRFQERIGMQAAFCFVALGAFLSLISGSNSYYDIEWLDSFINLGGWILAIFGWGGLYLFLPLYPDGRFVPRWSVIAPLTWLAGMIVTIFNPESPWAGDSDNAIVTLIIFIGMFGVPFVAQVYRYFRVSTQLQRQQTKFFIYGIVIVFLSIILSIFSGLDRLNPVQAILADLGDVLGATIFTLIPLAVGLAILRYRLWDIDIVINKSLVYGIFLGLALLFFTAVLAGLQIIIGQSQPLPALVIAGVVSAVLFRPAQKHIQNFVDRRIYRLNFNLNELAQVHKAREITRPGVLTGKTLNGYELGNLIGKGGMGEIYRAFKDNKTVAFKTLLPELAQDSELMARFQREIETGTHLKHRNIAEVYGSGTVDGTAYLIMEYIEGQDLHSLLKRDGVFDEETTQQIVTDICAALDVAHALGYVHRDIKPANIMLRENGEAVLMDFGISKAKDARTLTGTGAIGTIDYMAPEQIMSAKTVDHHADIYALGILAFELLTGEKPFKGNAAQVMFAHLQQPPPDARDIDPNIPDHIAEAIERAMAKKPEERFGSALDFATAISI